MERRGSAATLMEAVALFETVGMPARNLALRTRREYTRDLHDLLGYLECNGITTLESVRFPVLEGYLLPPAAPV